MNGDVSSNGQRPQPISFDDPAVIARLAVCAWLHGDEEAADAIAQYRPDIDLDALRQSIQCAVMTFYDLLPNNDAYGGY
jgi:hypothetical protein